MRELLIGWEWLTGVPEEREVQGWLTCRSMRREKTWEWLTQEKRREEMGVVNPREEKREKAGDG